MSTGVGVSSCCLSGSIREGKPSGHEKEIGGLNTYVAEPSSDVQSKRKTIIFLVDIFGWGLPNVRLLADSYAKAGFTAYIPDLHQGDSLPYDFLQDVEPPLPEREKLTVLQKTAATAKVGATLGPWLMTHREGVTLPLVEGFIKTVRLIPGTDKVGVIGFCWGGRYAILAAQKDRQEIGMGIDAAYACHPSLVAIPGDFEDVTKPLSLAVGDQDSLLDEKSVRQIEELLKKKDIPTEVRVYAEQVHGFALRGDWSSEKDRKAMDDAEKQGIDWFNKYLQ